MMRIAALLAVALVACTPASPMPSADAARPDAPGRWEPCRWCEFSCDARGRMVISPIPSADPFEPLPVCEPTCVAACEVPFPGDTSIHAARCWPIAPGGGVWEPTCDDGETFVPESLRDIVWRDAWASE